MASLPATVFGPVLRPPWSLHLPFAIAGHWQAVARLVFAPHRGTFRKSPGGFPFLSHPRRSRGITAIFSSLPRSIRLLPGLHAPGNQRLPTFRNLNVLDYHCLFPAGSELFARLTAPVDTPASDEHLRSQGEPSRLGSQTSHYFSQTTSSPCCGQPPFGGKASFQVNSALERIQRHLPRTLPFDYRRQRQGRSGSRWP